MQLPKNKQTLAVFLRDYGGRRKKSRSEKIAIMERIKHTRQVEINGETVKLTDEQWDLIDGLYHKYVLGKWNAQFTEGDIISLYKHRKQGYTIHEMAEILGCTDEIVRRRVNELVDPKDPEKRPVLIRGVNPENKRQGVFFIRKDKAESLGIPEVAA